MELLFDLLPLLVLYALARAFTRKKRSPARPGATVQSDAAAPTARPGFEQLLEALAAAQAEAERAASSPAEPPSGPTVSPRRQAPDDVRPQRPAYRPRRPQNHAGDVAFVGTTFDERSTFDPATASLDRRPTLEERAPLEGARFYDDAATFVHPPAPAADAHAGIDAGGFETAAFAEHGLRGHRPVAPPAPPPTRAAGSVAERLRNPATARDAFVMQLLLERRGRRR